MSALSLRKLLVLIAAVPVSAFLWVSSVSVFQSYQQYAQLKDQIIIQRLASIGGRIALVMPAESMSTPENRSARRKDVDTAIADVKLAFADWKAAGRSDAAIEKAYAAIADREKLLAPFRARVDAGTAVRSDNLAVFQPFSAAGLDLVRRSGGTINDLELSRLIDGYHALMQVHDAGLIERTLGRIYFSGRPFNIRETTFLHHARGLRGRYLPQFSEFLPADLVSVYNQFTETEIGKMLAATLQNMYEGKVQAKINRFLRAGSTTRPL